MAAMNPFCTGQLTSYTSQLPLLLFLPGRASMESHPGFQACLCGTPKQQPISSLTALTCLASWVV